MLKKICLVIIFNLFITPAVFAQSNTETITITTYYPAPYGVYNELSVNSLVTDIAQATTDEFQWMQDGDVHIGRSLIVGAGGTGYSYDELEALEPPISPGYSARPGDGDVLIKWNVGIGLSMPTRMTPVANLHVGGSSVLGYSNNDEVVVIGAAHKAFPRTDGTTNLWSANKAFWAMPMIYRSLRWPDGGGGTFPDNQYGELMLQGTSHGAWYNKGISFITWDGTAADPAFRMRIQDNGNVGIGTTTPGKRLHIYANDAAGEATIEKSGTGAGGELNLRFSGVNVAAGTFLGGIDFEGPVSGANTWMARIDAHAQDANQQTSYLTFSTANGAAPAERVRIDKNGNVGIGMSGFALLFVNGAIQMNSGWPPAKPVCAAAYRGTIWIGFNPGAGGADTVEACVQIAGGGYSWRNLIGP